MCVALAILIDMLSGGLSLGISIIDSSSMRQHMLECLVPPVPPYCDNSSGLVD